MKIFFLTSMLTFCIACGTTKSTDAKTVSNQFELNLADSMKPERISASFPKFGIRYLCTLDKIENICVFIHDQSKSLEEIMDMLSHEVGVESVALTKGCN